MPIGRIRPCVAAMILVFLPSVSSAADMEQVVPGSPQTVPAASLPSADQSLSRWALGVTGGTLGIGGELSGYVNPYIVVRVTGTYLYFNPTSLISKFETNDNNYNFTLSQITAGGLLDLHPFRNGFRLVTGLEYANFNFRQSVSSQSSYTINGTNYTSAQIGSLYTNARVKNEAAPYIGFGWDSAFYCNFIQGTNTAARCDRFTVGFDLGALYTGGVSISQSTDRNVPGLAANLAAESSSIQNTLNKFYFFYPVLMTTFKFRF